MSIIKNKTTMIKHIVFFWTRRKRRRKNKSWKCSDYQDRTWEPETPDSWNCKIEVGIHLPDAPAGDYDIALYSEFKTMADLDIYQVHPEHKG